MLHFYDGQIRRYITQIVRCFSNFSYKDAEGDTKQVPVTYGDLTRQVANIMRDNSENKIPSAPRMAVYITGLETDPTRLSDASYVSKVNIRERAYDADGQEYLNTEGKNYTVERLMPTPYKLTVNVDVWSTNTDQKLQIMEQILMLFNPSLEIQTTDNYIDWTSLSVLNLDSVTWSNRSIPIGVESEIDIGTMTLSTPIYISPPVKVKRLGVIQTVIASIFNEKKGNIELDLAVPYTKAYTQEVISNQNDDLDAVEGIYIDDDGNVVHNYEGARSELEFANAVQSVSYNNYDVLVLTNTVQIINRGKVGGLDWNAWFGAAPFTLQSGTTTIRLSRNDLSDEIQGTVAINTSDPTVLTVNWDSDTLPTDTVIEGPNEDRSKIDYIIDPKKTNPESWKSETPRILLLGSIGNSIRKKITITGATNRWDTGISFEEIYPDEEGSYGETVYVNGVKTTVDVVPESDNPDGTVVFKFSSMLDIDDELEYELFLNQDGPDAWKNADGTDFSASANDIVEWDGSRWHIVFDSALSSSDIYTTNLNTGIQYLWDSSAKLWKLSFEGEYRKGTWRIVP